MSLDMKETKKNDLKVIFAQENLEFTQESEWETLVDHIETHKYLINQRFPWTITWNDAVFSWYENVYRPLQRLIKQRQVRRAFPNMTLGQLFFAVSSHWYYLLEKYSNISAEEAVGSYISHYGQGIGKFLSKFILPTAA